MKSSGSYDLTGNQDGNGVTQRKSMRKIGFKKAICLVTAILGTHSVASPLLAQAATNPANVKQWWMDEPVRLVLTNLPENRSTIDTDKLIEQLVDLNANALLISMGGIAAHYPTKVEGQYASPFLPAGRDMFGEVLKKAHARGIRVMGRFDFSAVGHRQAYEAHRDWFWRQVNGQPVVYSGTYWTCINGGYYQEQVFKILSEALDKYPIDGLFFNAFGQKVSDYSGKTYGLCNCDNCKRLFRAKYNRDIPAQADAQYREFISEASRSLVARISELVHSKRPGINFMLGRGQASVVDSFNSETNTNDTVVGDRVYWVYASSQNVNSARTSFPNHMAFNNSAVALDYPWRFAHPSPPEGEIRLYQAMAHGAGPYLYLNGDMSQNDGNAVKGARSPFQFHKEHEELYVRQENAARVLLLEGAGGGPGGRGGGNTSQRGFFRILSEQHIPFAISNDLSWIDKEPDKYDLVISYRGAPAALDPYLRRGGRVLVAGVTKPQLDLPPVVKLWKREETESAYWRVQDRALLPSLDDTDIVFLYGEYLELEPRGKAALTMIPPSMYGPPEKVHVDWKDSTKPGLYLADYGKGKLAYIPWDLGHLYYRHSSVYHSAIVGDLVDHLMPGGRQLKTNAHPLVEITLMRQKRAGRTLVHFVNLSGHSQTAFHPAIPVSNIRVNVAGKFSSVRMISTGRDLPTRKEGGSVTFTLPILDTYEVVVLQQ
jgi:uncharacterized lipoprotein YddW (UPF0748 family)